jgi:hypothetical protein
MQEMDLNPSTGRELVEYLRRRVADSAA